MYELFIETPSSNIYLPKICFKRGQEKYYTTKYDQKASKMENTNASQLIRLSVHVFRKHAQPG